MNKVLFGFIKKEFSQTVRDPVMRVFLFVAPIFQMMLFGYAIDTDFKNIKLAVIHNISDTVAIQLSQKIFINGWFKKVESDNLDPNTLLQSGKADAVLIAPVQGIKKEIERGGAKLQLLIDAQNATKARAVEAYLNIILAQYLKEKFQTTKSGGGINFDVRVLYNPSMKTPLFMIPAIMVLIMCLATVMLTSMSIAREKEMGTFESLIAAPVKNIEIILGKTIPFIILGLIDGFFIIITGMTIFGVPLHGSILLLLIATLVFVCTTVSIGTLISTVSNNQQQAMMGTFLFVFVGNLLSGMMFPIENMPLAMRILAYFNPLKYFITILRNVMLKGNIPELFYPDLGILVVMMLVTVFVATRRFHQTLN